MEISVILPHVEALIFASEKPLTSLELTELINNALGFLDDKITLDQIESAVQGVIEKYDSDFYPFEIRESGGGWQFLTKKDYHKTVAQLNGDKFLKRLSAASLESLAIIAYKQPITKGEVESIRGVNSDYSIQKLLDKELIVITGRNEELPGKPLVYATSKHFMDYFGINSSDELPMIREILSSQPFLPTPVPQPNAEGLFKDSSAEEDRVEDNDPLVVRANGELIEEPRLVIDGITEVVEPDQVIENDPSDADISDETDDRSSETPDTPGDADIHSTEDQDNDINDDDIRAEANEDAEDDEDDKDDVAEGDEDDQDDEDAEDDEEDQDDQDDELIVDDLNEQLEEADDSGSENPEADNNIANESPSRLDEAGAPTSVRDEFHENERDGEDPNGEFSDEVDPGAEEDDLDNTSEDRRKDSPGEV